MTRCNVFDVRSPRDRPRIYDEDAYEPVAGQSGHRGHHPSRRLSCSDHVKRRRQPVKGHFAPSAVDERFRINRADSGADDGE